MTNVTTHEHDLEDHIPTLRMLDEARRRSAELRDEGVDALIKSICPPKVDDPLPAFGDWWGESSLVIRALLTRHDQPLGKEDEKKRLKLITSLINQLQKDFRLKELAENQLSVLVAAGVLRALVAQPGGAFSKTAMLCYYWIIRELYTADSSDWSIGGARATPGGLVTAFTTSECVCALSSFAKAMRDTGEFFAELGRYVTRTEQLNELNDFYFPNTTIPDSKPLKAWIETEKKSLTLSCFLKLRHLSRNLVIDLDLPVIDNPSDYLENIIDKINKFENNNEFSSALLEIDIYWENEQKERSESAHFIARKAVKDALDRLNENLALFNTGGNNKYEKVKGQLDDAAREVHKLLHPVRNYLSSVLDHELALISLGENWDCQPCELACAVASYGKLTEEWEKDTRFGRAVNDISKMVSSRGRFANPRHFHERPDGGRYMTGNAVSLQAVAQLLCYARDSEVEHELITAMAGKMLLFFEDTRASSPRDFGSFSIIDITPELIKKLGVIDDPKAEYIRSKLPENTQKSLALANGNNLPKALSNVIAVELVAELNKLDPFEEDSPLRDEISATKAFLNKEKVEKGEKYSRLLNRLCLQKVFSGDLRKIDEEELKNLTSPNKKGWSWEFSKHPLKTDLETTASSVMALAEINEMLDARINHIILEHFTVKKKNKWLDANLTLDSLFYPDYGLLNAPEAEPNSKPDNIEKKDWSEKGCLRKESVAIVLQQMRAHVSKLSLPNEYDPLCSLVLHGPAGTGKTTLVEALAVTCEVTLVEVTPSDLVKHGEENIEQRARAVFEALSMLTRVVILFDEFDPVLKRRDSGNNNPLSVFSFLTPGMLPKLKDLHTQAEKRSVAYVLVTNLIGELDEAAVRQGRFDERLGIYPPDLLSRVGRFLDQVGKDFYKINDVPWDRIVEIIKQTGGKGMTILGKPGWFTIPDEKREELKEKKGTPYHFLHVGKKPEWPEPDDELKGIRGEGRTAVTECLQWTWINKWDNKLKDNAPYENIVKALQQVPTLTECSELNFAQSSGDQWEVSVNRNKSFTRRMLIRRLKHAPDKK
ncbi:AAA family ATPase [Methyloglobulus sp.]|uniref:AAA family ATPase n=1 Tax=Methyloglobulus sp. TaxID=2518622 RepID=UPI003989C994